MAVSGASGWIPSMCYFINWKGELTSSGITQNKIRECVYSDITVNAKGSISEAALLLLSGERLEIDVRELQVVKLKRLISDYSNNS